MPDSVHAAVFLPLPQTTVHFWKDISVGPGKSVWSGVSDRLTAGIAIRLSLLIISGSRGFAHFWRPGWAVRRGLLGGRLHHRLHSKMCYQRQVEERQQGAGCSSRNAPAFDGKQASTAARADS